MATAFTQTIWGVFSSSEQQNYVPCGYVVIRKKGNVNKGN